MSDQGDAAATCRCTSEEAVQISKHGVDLTIYTPPNPSATVARVQVERGHFQEFYNTRSTYVYYIVSGRGMFYVDGVPHSVEASDVITVVPRSTVYYLGSMEMVLTVAPAFDERDEHHVRFVSENGPATGEQ